MNQDDLQRQANRAKKAEELFNNETLREAFSEIRDAVFKEFEQTPIEDDGARLVLRLKLQVMDDIRKFLKHRINLGHQAVTQLNALSKQDRQKIGNARERNSQP